MRYLNLASHIAIVLALVMLSACASTATRTFNAAEKLEAEGKYEAAMYAYAEAFKNDPTDNATRVRFFKTRQDAADQRYKMGMALSAKGNYADALIEFQAAQSIDPTQERFRQQVEILSRYKDAQAAFLEGQEFEKANKLKDAHRQYIKATELFPDNTEFQSALDRIMHQSKSKLEGYELRLKSSKPVTLKFKDAKIKDVFNILTQLSGINFIFDEGIKDSPISVYLENASFQQALDLLSTMNKLDTKILNETTVLLYQNTPDKNKQYDDMVLRTFHLNFMDAKKAVNLIRTMVQVRKIYVNEESNSIVVRDTEDVVSVVEKILDANDLPEAEVVLDVEVMEVNDKNAENIGLLLSNYNVQVGAFSPDNKLMATTLNGATVTAAAGTTTITTGGGDVSNLVRAFSIKDFGGYVTVPNATYNFGKTLAKGEVLSNPKIRVKNKEKAKFNVGTRVPITTTTLNGTVSQVNVQYVDVGVKVNAEPTIQLNNEITIKLNLEVSSILTKEKVGSDGLTTVVTIGTRNIETVLSLKDNETSVIGGLIQRTNNNDKSKLFLLSDIPLIGPLFTNSNSSKDKTELVLAITPRLVRGISVPTPGLASFASGKEDHPSLDRDMASFDQEPVFTGETDSKAVTKKKEAPQTQIEEIKPKIAVSEEIVAPAATAPAATAPVVQPVQTLPPSQSRPRMTSDQPVTEKPVPLSPTEQLHHALLQIAAPSSVSVGQRFSLDVKVSDAKDLVFAPFVLTYDPAFVEFSSASEGPVMNKDGKPTTFSNVFNSAEGTVSILIGRNDKKSGISGSGVLATVSFTAKSGGSANFGFKSNSFTASDGSAMSILPFSTAVDIR